MNDLLILSIVVLIYLVITGYVGYVAWRRTKTADDYEGRDREVFLIFDKMHKAARHKMDPIPVCDIPEEWR